MSQVKHTPGPWKIGKYGNIVDAENKSVFFRTVVDINQATLEEENEAKANTVLAAAAPELLEALEFLLIAFGEKEKLATEKAINAICKAKYGEEKE